MLRLGLPSTCSPARTERGGRPLHQRDALIDLTRGLLFLLMTHSHALALAHVSVDSFWQSGYWLPRGWATVCFILLSGYTVGFLLPWQGHQAVTRTKLLRRGRDLLVVMFVSNVVFLALDHVATGSPGVLLQWHWWLGLVTVETPSSISAILLPTGVLLLIAPLLLTMEEAHPAWFLGLVVLGTVGVAWAQVSMASRLHRRLLTLLLDGERLGVPVLLFLAYGSLGMAVGRLSRRWPTRRLGLVVTGVTGFALLQSLHHFSPHSAVVHVLCSSLLPPTQLAVVMSVSWMLLATRWQPMAGFFRLMGFYALFAFVVHRILLQTIHLGLHALQVGDAVYQYLLLGAGTMLLTFCLCWWRHYHAASLRPRTTPGLNMATTSFLLVRS